MREKRIASMLSLKGDGVGRRKTHLETKCFQPKRQMVKILLHHRTVNALSNLNENWLSNS